LGKDPFSLKALLRPTSKGLSKRKPTSRRKKVGSHALLEGRIVPFNAGEVESWREREKETPKEMMRGRGRAGTRRGKGRLCPPPSTPSYRREELERHGL